ncbi:restriction endonuclease subunit S [Vibrio vulnificus]|uniref:restriction endonuclease subunit S n=1 Tax=Vibrio vulnificus TaxID=672 RepID=UPI001CDB9284|nr:restriction endonuclease subunit S [Vibrio vulnificus]MCA4023934.1 restriction endonuclease subunit S [Vibrio vulnificus]
MKIENLITEHIDIWTSAVKTKSTSGRGSSKKLELYGVKKLRELILELAVRGKLVPQDPNDEPASLLLERIAAEKAQLVKDKKIKKPKKLPKIKKEEAPFKLPKGWSFSRLEDLCELITKGSSPKWQGVSYTENPEDVLFVTSENVGAFELLLENRKYVEKKFNDIEPRSILRKEDFLMNIVGASIGRTALYDIDDLANINQAVCLIRSFPQQVSTRFFLTFFNSLTCVSYMYDKQVENARPNLSMGNISKFVIPVPPIHEQHRIVAKVDELMALCDQLEQQTEASIEAHQVLVTTLLDTLTNSADADELMQNWARISEHFDTLFSTEESIDQLKQTILQLAVMGKLVPQDPSDEPAAELLKRIADEKAQLVKDKKIKKQKALPPISEGEKPFELPNGWEWCRLPDLGELARGKSKHRPRNDPKLYENGNIPLVQTGDVARANGTILTYTAKYNEFGLAQSQLWPKGTLCITIAANIADTATLGFDACFPDSVVGYTPYDKEIPTVYFDYFIKTAKENLERFAPSTAQKNINLEILSNVLVPCPPMQQFPRIVEKVNLLLGICDELKERLKESQMSQLQLTDAIVEQAV